METRQFSTLIAGRGDAARLIHQEELDFHFYLICWDKVQKYFSLVQKFEDDEAITESYKNISELLDDAVDGRDFYEHLDDTLQKGGVGTRGRGFSYPEGYHFSVVRIDKGKQVPKEAKLGMEEIRRVREAYEDVIAVLKARGDTR
jgi:hypothetical protein